MGIRINVGCGLTPTPGWTNYDNSLSVRIAQSSILSNLLIKSRLLREGQCRAIESIRNSVTKIVSADASRRIPADSGTVEVVYSSHMLEHLDRAQARRFLSEAARVLKPGGIIRLAVPDLRKLVDKYLVSGDANAFVSSLYMSIPRPKMFTERVHLAFVGFRHHQWMYDAGSLSALLMESGFGDVASVLPGETRIASPGELDLNERANESLYVEAFRR